MNMLCLCHKIIDVLSGANALINLSEAWDNELVHELAQDINGKFDVGRKEGQSR